MGIGIKIRDWKLKLGIGIGNSDWGLEIHNREWRFETGILD